MAQSRTVVGFATPTPGSKNKRFNAPAFYEQSLQTAAQVTAKQWLSVKTNKLSLPIFNQGADADGDGLLSKEEFAEMLMREGGFGGSAARLYEMLDKDGDGQLTQEEMKQLLHKAGSERFKATN